jgi:hypothetical protein
MKIARILVPIAGLTLATAPVVAQAADAEMPRIASPIGVSEGFAADPTAYILFGFLVALGAILVAQHSGEEEDLPLSP